MAPKLCPSAHLGKQITVALWLICTLPGPEQFIYLKLGLFLKKAIYVRFFSISLCCSTTLTGSFSQLFNMEPNQKDEQPAQTPSSPHEAASESLVNSDPGDQNNQLKSRENSSLWSLASKLFVLELLAVVLSTALLIAIIVILASFNHHPQPHWEHMSLNSLISWLSTISKGSVLFAISESLGQLKWLWFTQKSRAISDLQTFDAASRGFFGSAMLMWDLRAK